MNNFDEFANFIRGYLDDGAMSFGKNREVRICRLSGVGTHAYLHVLFPGLSELEIQSEEKANEYVIHSEFRKFLTLLNGAILFQGGISIYGVRGEISRDPEIRKPFDLYEANTIMRPVKSAKDDFYIGSLSADGSRLYLKDGEPTVYRRGRNSPEVLQSWTDIHRMLSSEIARIAQAYDRSGIKKSDAAG